MPHVGFEPTISAGEQPQTYALDRAATGTGTDTNANALYYGYIGGEPEQREGKVIYNLFLLSLIVI